MSTTTSPAFQAGLWRLADPKISLASFSSLALALGITAAYGTVQWGWFLLTVLGIFAVEVAKNASGEIFDWITGVDLAVLPSDRSPFSGGKRVIVDNLLSIRETAAISVSGYSIGIISGLVITMMQEPSILPLGIVGVALVYFYHAPPLKLSYRGFGEIAVALTYGPLICAGAVLVQLGELPPGTMGLAIPLGLWVGGFLWINEFPDYLADKAADKKTLVVRLGRPAAGKVFQGLMLTAALLAVITPLVTGHRGALLGALAIVPAARASGIALATPEVTSSIIPAQIRALAALVLYGIGAGLGINLMPEL